MAKGDQKSLCLNQRHEKKKMKRTMKNMRRTLKQLTEMLKRLIQEKENMNTMIGSLLPCSIPPGSSDHYGSDDHIDFSISEDNLVAEDANFVPESATDSEATSLVDDVSDSDLVLTSAPVYTSERIEDKFIKMAMKVVKGYNSNQGTKFKFQKLMSVASTYDRGVRYYFMYIEVKDSDGPAADPRSEIFHVEIADYGSGEGCVEACEIQDQC